jgi:hypothetical protein
MARVQDVEAAVGEDNPSARFPVAFQDLLQAVCVVQFAGKLGYGRSCQGHGALFRNNAAIGGEC